MVKTAGLGDGLYVNGYDLSGDTSSVGLKSKIGEQNVTGLDKSAMERLQLLGDGEINFRTFHTGDTSDSGAVHAHKRLRALANTAQATYFNGATADNFAAGLVCKQFDYTLDRGDSGSLLAACTAKSSSGVDLEIGRVLDRVGSASSSGTNGAALDLTATHGWGSAAFHLHVTAFTGTSVTLIIQTDDNSGFTTPATYGTFAVVSGRTYERLAVASAPERYVRWRANAGTFSAVSFAVAIFRTT